MSSNFLWYPGTGNNGLLTAAFNLLTTEMNSLASGSLIVSSVGGSTGVFSTSNTLQALYADMFLTLGAIGSALSAGANLSGWFLTSPDGGTTFESGTVQPPRTPDFTVDLPTTTISGGSVYRGSGNGPNGSIILPALKFKVLVLNNSGQSFAASSNSLEIAPYAEQY